VGFDPGTLSFDAQRGLKTATEVISEDSKTFGTVKANENGFKDALEEMVHAIFDLAVRYNVEWEGQPVAQLLTGGYSVAVTFDDSIIQDRAANIDEGIKLVGAQLMSRYKFMTETLGYTPEEAEAEIKRIAEEQRVSAATVDTVLFSASE
jgi:A118 family predicted phage portal protein